MGNVATACYVKPNLIQPTKQVHAKIKDYEWKQCNYLCFLKGDIDKHVKAVHLKIKDLKLEQCGNACSCSL